MSFLRRFLAALVGKTLYRLEREAAEYGRISLHQADVGSGGYVHLGWSCSIRPTFVKSGPHAHRYTWTGEGSSIEEALDSAIKEARGNPMTNIAGAPFAPRLSAKEFDDES